MCKTPGKHPMLGDKWQKQATTDEDTIRKWFKKHPHAHVGIMPPEGHVIIDIDPRNGGKESITALLGDKVPKTVTQESGGGGYHLIYEGECKGISQKEYPGIDVKREGRGFVVAWPSAHVSGGSYRWRNAPWDMDPTPIPKALVDARPKSEFTPLDDTPPPIPLDTIRTALAYIDADDYHRWINIGQALKHAYGDDGQELWEEWSKTSSSYNEGDEEKWDTFDHNRDRPLITIRSIMAIARRSGYRPLTPEFDNALWAKADVSEFFDTDPIPMDWVCLPCLPAGKVCLLAGAGGSSKSYLSLELAMHVAIGEPFGPFKPTKPGKALLLVAEEDREDIHRRIAAIRAVELFGDDDIELIKKNVGVYGIAEEDWRMLFHDEAGDPQETEVVEQLIQEVKAIGDCRLLVIDPMVAFNGGSENDSADMAKLMFTLNRIAKTTKCCVLVVHHTNKQGSGNETFANLTQGVVRGSSALVDNARAVIVFARMTKADAPLYNVDPGQAGKFVMCGFVKNNYGPHTPDTVFAIGAGGALRHAPEVTKVHATVAKAQRVMEDASWPLRIARTMQEHPEDSVRDWARALNTTHTTVNKYLRAMEDEQHVRRMGVGNMVDWELTKKGTKWLSKAASQDDSDDEDLIG